MSKDDKTSAALLSIFVFWGLQTFLIILKALKLIECSWLVVFIPAIAFYGIIFIIASIFLLYVLISKVNWKIVYPKDKK